MPDNEKIEAERTLPAKTLDFWFDYTCPYAYLGSTQVAEVAKRMSAALTYKPVLLGGIFRALGTPQRLFASRGAARSAHEGADMNRWAKHLGVTLKMPAEHPRRSVEALRATLACGVDPKVIAGFYRAYWVEGREISSPETMRAVLSAAGHDADKVLDAIATPEIKDDLKKRTDEGIALGMFGVPVWIVDGKHFYWGQDRIPFVEGVRPPPRAPKRSTKTIEVFWDFSSPFAYLGAVRIGAIAARTGAKIEWKPMLLGGLFKSLGGPDVPLATFPAAKQAYIMQDLHRWAAYAKVRFKFPSVFPINSLKALRLYLALPEAARGAFRDCVFTAAWAEDRDVTKDEVLAECGATPEAFARMGSDDVKAALRSGTEEAATRGVFGAPTFIVDGELYWGQDRLDLVEDVL